MRSQRLAFYLVLATIVVGVFDYANYYVGYFLNLPLLASSLVAVIHCARKRAWPPLLASAIAALFLALLPWVNWNEPKKFFSACQQLRVGMQEDQVLAIMNGFQTRDQRVEGSGMDVLIFFPSHKFPDDWCRVTLSEGRLSLVEFLPD